MNYCDDVVLDTRDRETERDPVTAGLKNSAVSRIGEAFVKRDPVLRQNTEAFLKQIKVMLTMAHKTADR